MSNLTNVYAFLRNNYADIDIYFGNKPITYLDILFGLENEKFLFIYKEVIFLLFSSVFPNFSSLL